MKRNIVVVKILLALLFTTVAVVIYYLIQNDRLTWIAWNAVAKALQNARSVTLVEYARDTELARKTATPEEISQLRKAVRGWWYPFFGGIGYLCYDSHHRIEIVRSDGSILVCFVSFKCERFLTDDDRIPPGALPPHIYKPMSLFFTSMGMKRSDKEYEMLDFSGPAIKSNKQN